MLHIWCFWHTYTAGPFGCPCHPFRYQAGSWVLSGSPCHPFRYQAGSAPSRDECVGSFRVTLAIPFGIRLIVLCRATFCPWSGHSCLAGDAHGCPHAARLCRASRSRCPPLSATTLGSPLTCLPVASPPGRAPERHLSYELLGVCVCCLACIVIVSPVPAWLSGRRSSLPRLVGRRTPRRWSRRSPASPPGRAPERHLSYELLGVCVCCLPASPPSTMCMLAHRRPCG